MHQELPDLRDGEHVPSELPGVLLRISACQYGEVVWIQLERRVRDLDVLVVFAGTG